MTGQHLQFSCHWLNEGSCQPYPNIHPFVVIVIVKPARAFSFLLDDCDPLVFSRGLLAVFRFSYGINRAICCVVDWAPFSMFYQGDDQDIARPDIGEQNWAGVSSPSLAMCLKIDSQCLMIRGSTSDNLTWARTVVPNHFVRRAIANVCRSVAGHAKKFENKLVSSVRKDHL